jgi:hypothetical protein
MSDTLWFLAGAGLRLELPNRIVHSWLGNSHGVAANDNFR